MRRQTGYIETDLLITDSPIPYYLVDTGRRLYGKHTFGSNRLDWRDKSLFIRMLIFLIILAVGGMYVFRGYSLCRVVSELLAISLQRSDLRWDEYLQISTPSYSRVV